MNAIETHNLGKTFEGGIEAVRDLSFSVAEGAIFGLLGPNGAGKSTTVRLLNGTLTASTGRSTVLGRESKSRELRRETATVTETARMYEHMTVAENLEFFALLYELPCGVVRQRTEELLDQLEISAKRDERLGTLSTGLRKRVQLARALLHRPRIVFLDEPTAGLDPESAGQVIHLIETLARTDGATVLLCTHNLPLAERICDGFAFLADGRLTWSGTKPALLESITTERRVRLVTTNGVEERAFERDEDVNDIIQDAIRRGAVIREVRQQLPSLEDAYFHHIGTRRRNASAPAERSELHELVSD
jgi:ABC-2 type transport system ATP-binding protein